MPLSRFTEGDFVHCLGEDGNWVVGRIMECMFRNKGMPPGVVPLPGDPAIGTHPGYPPGYAPPGYLPGVVPEHMAGPPPGVLPQ